MQETMGSQGVPAQGAQSSRWDKRWAEGGGQSQRRPREAGGPGFSSPLSGCSWDHRFTQPQPQKPRPCLFYYDVLCRKGREFVLEFHAGACTHVCVHTHTHTLKMLVPLT